MWMGQKQDGTHEPKVLNYAMLPPGTQYCACFRTNTDTGARVSVQILTPVRVFPYKY